MKLIELAKEFQTLYEIASDTDDIETLNSLFEQVQGELEVKADSTRVVLSKLDSDIDFLDKEIKRLQERKKSITNNKESLKGLLQWAMYSSGQTKIKTASATFYFQKTESVKVECDTSSLEDQYKKIKVEPNLTELKKALKNGVVIDGVTLEEKEGLRIR